jgi:hypothetical protein
MRANPQKTPYTFARAYVHMGYAVLPLAPGEKRPHGGLVPNGLKEASREAATLEAWWRACPGCGVGILAPEGVLVLDVDEPGVWDALRGTTPPSRPPPGRGPPRGATTSSSASLRGCA